MIYKKLFNEATSDIIEKINNILKNGEISYIAIMYSGGTFLSHNKEIFKVSSNSGDLVFVSKNTKYIIDTKGIKNIDSMGDSIVIKMEDMTFRIYY